MYLLWSLLGEPPSFLEREKVQDYTHNWLCDLLGWRAVAIGTAERSRGEREEL